MIWFWSYTAQPYWQHTICFIHLHTKSMHSLIPVEWTPSVFFSPSIQWYRPSTPWYQCITNKFAQLCFIVCKQRCLCFIVTYGAYGCHYAPQCARMCWKWGKRGGICILCLSWWNMTSKIAQLFDSYSHSFLSLSTACASHSACSPERLYPH